MEKSGITRCVKCGRIPAFCNCKQIEVAPTMEVSIDLIEQTLTKHGFRGWVSFVQSESQSNGILEKYWVSYFCKIEDGVEYCKGTEKHFPTALSAYMGILLHLNITPERIKDTTQSCGLLPSELLKQRDELREALQGACRFISCSPLLKHDGDRPKGLERWQGLAESAIKSTER